MSPRAPKGSSSPIWRARSRRGRRSPAISLAVVCRDGPRMQQLARALEFFAPDLPVLQFPAWDCQPYDRVSPHGGILAQRLTTLARLSRLTGSDKPLIVLTTVNAIVQRVPARDVVAAQALSVAPGHVVPMDSDRRLAGAQRLQPFLDRARARRIRRARRHPRSLSGRARPARALRLLRRLLEIDPHLRCRNPAHAARHARARPGADLGIPARHRNHPPLSAWAMSPTFGAPQRDDLLYEAVSEGRRHPGMEHWLPLFQERMDTLFDYLDDAPVAIEPQGEDAARERFKQIADYYEARREALEHPGGGAIYKPLPPDRLYLTEAEWTERLGEARAGAADAVCGARGLPTCSTPARGRAAISRRSATTAIGQRVRGRGRARPGVAGAAQEGRDHAVERRLARPHGQHAARPQARQPHQRQRLAHGAGDAAQRGHAGRASAWRAGFETDDVAVISEQDILGDRLVRPRKANRKLENFISEVTSLASGDLVVHVEHGIGRFVGLQTLEVGRRAA